MGGLGEDNKLNVNKNFHFPLNNGVVTSKFGERNEPVSNKISFHNGLDIGVPENSEVYAMCDGYIKKVGEDKLNGIFLEYQTIFGYIIIYAHLNSYSVKEGDFVSKGQVIAFSGNTGYSTGPHLHISIKDLDGKYVNPEDFF